MPDSVLVVPQPGQTVPIVTQDGQVVPAMSKPISALVEALGSTFVFRPGGVAGGNVYTTWSSMMAAVNAIDGPKFIEIDPSLAAANVDPGHWDVNQCTFFAQVGPSQGPSATLNFPDNGCSLTFNNIYLQGDIEFLSASSTPIVNVPALDNVVVLINEGAILASGTAPFFQVQNTGSLIFTGFATLGDGAHELVNALAGASVAAVLFGSVVNPQAFGGAATSVLSIASDTQVLTPQGTPPTILLLSQADVTAYTPAVAANWNPAPTQVAAALDDVVSPNTSNKISAAPISPFTTLAITANLTRKRGGLFLVTATLSGTDSTNEVVTVTLVRDGATVIGATQKLPTSSPGGVATFGGSIQWIDIIADALPHSWSVNAVGSAGGTLSVATGGVAVEAAEL